MYHWCPYDIHIKGFFGHQLRLIHPSLCVHLTALSHDGVVIGSVCVLCVRLTALGHNGVVIVYGCACVCVCVCVRVCLSVCLTTLGQDGGAFVCVS